MEESMRLSNIANENYKTSMGPEDTQDVMKFKNEVKQMKQEKLKEELEEQTRYKKEKKDRLDGEERVFDVENNKRIQDIAKIESE